MAAVNEHFGEQVRIQGQGGAASELIFNSTTGEFELRPRGSAGTGDVVTPFSETGFA